MIAQIKNIFMHKRVAVLLIAVAIVIVSAGLTAAALMWVVPKNGGKDQSDTSKNQSPKQRADGAKADANKLLAEVAKMGSGKAADKKTEEAAAKFEEASKLYKQAGDKKDSYETQANADSLRSRLAAEEPFKKQQEAEWAKQKAAMEAAKAAMAAGN